MLSPPIENVEYDENAERVRVVLPLERHWIFLGLYSLLLVVWLAVTIWMLRGLFTTSITQLPLLFAVVWVVILLVWAYVWYRVLRSLWRWWRYYAATREILYVYEDILVVHRPLPLVGVSDAYDMKHVSPFYYNTHYSAIAFDYGARGGLFGGGLPETHARRLVRVLNYRIFPQALLDEEEQGDQAEAPE